MIKIILAGKGGKEHVIKFDSYVCHCLNLVLKGESCDHCLEIGCCNGKKISRKGVDQLKEIRDGLESLKQVGCAVGPIDFVLVGQ